MARLPRLDLAGHLHLVIQRGRAERPVFVDDDDRRRYVGALLESSREYDVAVHAYALVDDQVLLLATPATAGSLARFVQAVGLRFVKAFNHRHGRSGPLWEGRYRTTVLDADTGLLEAMRFVEQAPVRAGLAASVSDWPWSSATHHAGLRSDPVVTEHAAYWRLGNTPFDREARYRTESVQPLTPAQALSLTDAAVHGWPVGPESFLHMLAATTERPVRPRARGRPRAVK